MKTKLLSLLALASTAIYAQTPVDRIFPDDDTVWEITTSGTPLNEPSGANQTWVFDQLLSLGSTVYNQGTPTAAQVSTYPTSTGVLEATDAGSIFYKNVGSTLSITGVAAEDLNINYSTNNAAVGVFPMSFGYSNSDTTAGTYSGMGYSGTFSGNISTTVDAWGTLTANILYVTSPIAVTRVKVVQTLSLNYLIFTGIGTATQTINTYYNQTTGPIFRTTSLVISVPQLGINESSVTYESLMAGLLTAPQASVEKIGIAPNPVKNALRFTGNAQIESVAIFDVTGKQLLSVRNPGAEINVDGLSKGVYIAKIKTATESQTQRFVKE
ncbi:MAG: T9SS type A sorting domain-containing protein [Flavobacterium sp.]|uniref:T9SS type A sorting domain-containing protein n=1 Tax=Flavobacterium sp. TaxID=239 RepID=UPI00121B59F3|nr:T9SS type A sorting domain-containing protein [Flavobacterium sp.]RZJ67231.1 MAG: T9SS type A sorting domain-containing protein [Flavobacterium sp.]